MLRLALDLLALLAAGSAVSAIEARLDRGGLDRTSLALLITFGGSLAALIILLGLRFGRVI